VPIKGGAAWFKACARRRTGQRGHRRRVPYKVLLVDVSKLPENFGVPAESRSDVAVNVGVVIMDCWTAL
jgi:hypothetical protein